MTAATRIRMVPPTYTSRPRVVELTPVRADCLECICRGLDTDDIARQLHVTRNTVKVHVRDVLAALGARDRLQAAVLVWSGEVLIDVVPASNEKST